MGEQAAVDSDSCVVDDMTNGELYDCCTSDAAAATCQVFGSIHAVSVGLIILSWGLLLYRSEWFRYNLLLSFTFQFQLITAVYRALFYLSSAYSPTSAGTYRIIR